MAHIFEIHSGDETKVTHEEPEVGAWYCGFERDFAYDGPCKAVDGFSPWRDGAIAQYVGDGYFIDEYNQDVDMDCYDFLIKQS